MKKSDGFKDQRTIIIPDYILSKLENDTFHGNLYLTDIGYYPAARNHYRSRKEGCPQYILLYCIKGKGWIEIYNKRMIINENQYFIIPPNTPHQYGADEKQPWSLYWAHFAGKNAPFYTRELDKADSISTSEVDRIKYRLEIFNEIIANLEMGFSENTIGYCNILFGYFLATFKYLEQFRHIRTSKAGDMIGESIIYMKNNRKRKISLDELAENACLSPSYYSSEFKRKTGKTPIDYLTHLRIQEACQLLDHTSLRIKEISNKVGFEDPFYFSRVFKNVMGLSPKEYRKHPKG
ncbi:AraC family transcriptional regulator [Persicobacter diffluens]|uniref:Transcriptional regulator n=1 Tax=Persicobacter diffluens TaxID=981 RepID=A0AAN5AQ22_9BACT|nr:transcriptional regulator [Persicobacter diffluens]